MMIQDVQALVESEPRPADLLERLRSQLLSCEPFECGELVVRAEGGLARFVIAPGLGAAAGPALDAIAAKGPETTLRLDTREDLQGHGIPDVAGLTSILILRVEAPGLRSAAIVLGHSRTWSFAAAPLSRIRALANLTLRLLARLPAPVSTATPRPVHAADPETVRLKAQVEFLESEVVKLRTELASKRNSGKPR